MISPLNTTALLASSPIPSNPLLGASRHMTPQQAEIAAHDFESMFLAQMLEQMFGDSVGNEAFGDSESSEIYKGLLLDAYGKEIDRAGGIGIADYVKKELLKLQEM